METTTQVNKRLAWPGLCLMGAIGLLLPVSSSAAEILRGQAGDWQLSWCGVNAEVSANLGGAATTLGQALQAAGRGDAVQFYGLLDIDTNRPPETVKQWFRDWRMLSQEYVYLIGEVAVGGKSNSMAAVSFAPAAARPATPVRDSTNQMELQAQVVFARQVAGNWRLLSEPVDKIVESSLLARAATWVIRPPMTFTKESLTKLDQQHNRFALEQMRKDGAPPEFIASVKERYLNEEAGKTFHTWTAWTNNYKTEIFFPPIEFNKRDPFPYSFRDPVSACRSYLRAMWVGDARTLLTHADATGRKSLQQLGVNEETKQPTYDLTNAFTRVAILFVATTEFENQTIALVFRRVQREKDPHLGNVSFQTSIFVKEGDEYHLTMKLEHGHFGRVLDAAGVKKATLKYAEFQNELRQSSFPPHFYAIP